MDTIVADDGWCTTAMAVGCFLRRGVLEAGSVECTMMRPVSGPEQALFVTRHCRHAVASGVQPMRRCRHSLHARLRFAI